MRRIRRDVRRAPAWPGAVCLGLLLPLPLVAEPTCPVCPPAPSAQKATQALPGPETRNPDDFELFLEGILEAPRGQKAAVPGDCPLFPHYAPAKPACPGCCALGVTDKKPSATAAAVQWRTDYGKARDEAKDKGRPLMLLVRSAFCPWCDKLDAAIREDSEACKLLNESTVPLELSAAKNQAVVDALRIDAYPTIVVAAADGKILLRLTGYRDAAALKKELREGLEKNVLPAPAPDALVPGCVGR